MAEMNLNLIAILPECFLALCGLGLLLYGVLREDEDGERLIRLSVSALFATAVIVVMVHDDKGVAMNGQVINDSFGAYLKGIILLGAAACLIITPQALRALGANRFEYAVLAIFATLGMMLMVSANSLLSLYMALELQSLPLYVMTAFRRDAAKPSEAGLKYFALGALASGMLLYGCSLVYGFTGTITFDGLAAYARVAETGSGFASGAVVGLVFVAAGLAFKLSAVPFHMWTPDVYEGAPTPVTAFLAAAPKVAAMGLAVRVFLQPFGDWLGEWQQIIVFIAIASMVLGAFAAIGQSNFKRLMAYSSIGHVGYALVGLAAGTEEGAGAVALYMTIYLIMTLGTFACLLLMKRDDETIERVDDFRGLAQTNMRLAVALAIFMFSLAGIPPFAGFIGKLYVFSAAINAGLTPLAVIGVLASAVSAFYYLRIVKLMFFDDVVDAVRVEGDGAVGWVAGLCAVFTGLLIVYPAPVLTSAIGAASALFP